MSTPATPRTAILYQNPTRTVTLLDIPTSISVAQGTSEYPSTARLYSSQALQKPYPSTEPKSNRAKANVMKMVGSADLGFPETLLFRALDEVDEKFEGEWCLPRDVSPLEPLRRSNNPKFAQVASRGAAEMTAQYCTIDFVEPCNVPCQGSEPRSPLKMSITSPPRAFICPNVDWITDRLVHNPTPIPLSLHVFSASQTYRVPPYACVMLSSIDAFSAASFSHAARDIYPNASCSAGRAQFDFIVLDPPWDNRSVRRSRKYNTIRQDMDPMRTLKDMLGQHIGEGALVGCWITNKASVRESALKLFEAWSTTVIEEWAWLKTTVTGAPVTEVDGLWRKPYEILLLGRKQNVEEREHKKSNVTRSEMQKRVILAVPDLHSRKPCLKELVEPMMPHPVEYRALEIFARNLTAGWWSWGDEVLEFNLEDHWLGVKV